LSNHLLINLTDLTNEKEDGLDKRNDPKETGYSGDADSSSSEASAPQSSDSEDDISARTKPTTTATTTATRKGMIASNLELIRQLDSRNQVHSSISVFVVFQLFSYLSFELGPRLFGFI